MKLFSGLVLREFEGLFPSQTVKDGTTEVAIDGPGEIKGMLAESKFRRHDGRVLSAPLLEDLKNRLKFQALTDVDLTTYVGVKHSWRAAARRGQRALEPEASRRFGNETLIFLEFRGVRW